MEDVDLTPSDIVANKLMEQHELSIYEWEDAYGQLNSLVRTYGTDAVEAIVGFILTEIEAE